MSANSAATVLPVSSLFQPSSEAIPVLDPELKAYGRLWLPKAWVELTLGLGRCHPSIKGDSHPSSLCLLYQAEKCQAGPHCHQIHVRREGMAAVRAALKVPVVQNCC
eukprot:RCo001176